MLDVWNVVLIAYDLMHIREVVPLVSAQVLLHRGTTDNYREDQVIDRPFVVFVRARDVKRQRSTTLIDQDMDLATELSSIRWVLACLLTTQWRGARLAVYGLPLPADVSLSCIVAHHGLQDLFPDALLLPGLETIMNHTTRNTKPVFVNGFPLAPRPQDIPDAVQCSLITRPGASWPTLLGRFGKVLLDSTPQLTRHSQVVDILGLCGTIPFQGMSSLSMGS